MGVSEWAGIVCFCIGLIYIVVMYIITPEQDKPKLSEVVLAFIFAPVLTGGIGWGLFRGGEIAISFFSNKTEYIVVAGKVINSRTGEWPNDRLVMIYQGKDELARSITALGESGESQLGKVDGFFELKIPNTYEFTITQFEKEKVPYKVISTHRWIGGRRYGIIYIWVGDIEEGSQVQIYMANKNVKYTVRVLDGAIETLPVEITRSTKTELRDGEKIVIVPQASLTPDSEPTFVVSTNDSPTSTAFSLENITYDTGTEEIVINKFTVPINNCGGSAELKQKYSDTQTFVYKYVQEKSISGGIEIKIPVVTWAQLLGEIQGKYGFEQNQIGTKTVEYEITALPGTNQVYTFTWKEIWDRGYATLKQGGQQISVPFKVKTSLTYEVNSEAGICP